MNQQKAEVKKEEIAKKGEITKKEAFLVIKSLVDTNPDKKYKEALMIIRPSLYGVASSSNIQSRFIDLVCEKGTVHENDIFAQLKIGRKECASIIRKSLQKAEKVERVWISFDNTKGVYKVEGKGSNPPKDWKGYVPVIVEIPQKLL